MVSNEVSILAEDRMLDMRQKAGVCLFILVVQCGTNDQYVSTLKRFGGMKLSLLSSLANTITRLLSLALPPGVASMAKSDSYIL